MNNTTSPIRGLQGKPCSILSPKKDANFYLKSATSGALAACFTHFIMVPVDVIKTRMQLSSAAYPSTKVALQMTLQKEGIKGLTLGLGPTNYGYLTQGFFKYGLYEVFKCNFAKAIGQERAEKNAIFVYLAAGMTAELVADLFLTPFEAVRIRLVSDPTFARGTATAIGKVARTEGISGLYKGLFPLVMKQVPYTAVKFAVFEGTEELIYERLMPWPRHELSNTTQLAVTATSGFVGGVVAAIASHPADTVLTKVNVTDGGLLAALNQAGFRGLWTGLIPRMGMVGVLASLQLLVYDAAKVALFGLPTSQGIKSHHRHQE